MEQRISVGLVGCGKAKAPDPQPARLLYRGQLTRAAADYATAAYDHWFYVSAQHYLVHPDERLAPYDKRLDDMSRSDREHWASIVESGIRLGYGCNTPGRLDWPALPGRVLLGEWLQDGRDHGIDRRLDLWFHCGAVYADPIRAHIAELGGLPYDLHAPLAGLGIGEQLAWYADRKPTLF